jgi:hypothetical protein
LFDTLSLHDALPISVRCVQLLMLEIRSKKR